MLKRSLAAVGYFRVEESEAGEAWSLTKGQVLKVPRGATGRKFEHQIAQGRLVELDAPPANVTPIPFNPAALDVEPRKPVAKPAPVTHAAVLERFRWTQQDLDNAIVRVGFPRPSGHQVTRRGPVPVWDARQLDEWAAAIKATAGGLR